MADDIVERLRAKDVLTSIITSCFAVPGRHPGELADLMEEAADEIERLRQAIEQATQISVSLINELLRETAVKEEK